MKFTTELTGIDVALYHLPEDYESKTVTVHWQVELECRDWGVKNILAYVTKVEAEIELESGLILNDFEDWEIESEIEIGETIQVTDVQFDFSDKTITVQ